MLRLSLKKNSFLLANFLKDEMKGKRAMFELVGKKYYVSGVKIICFLLCVSRLQNETCFHYLFVFYDHGKRHANKTSQKEQALANKRQKGGVKKGLLSLLMLRTGRIWRSWSRDCGSGKIKFCTTKSFLYQSVLFLL